MNSTTMRGARGPLTAAAALGLSALMIVLAAPPATAAIGGLPEKDDQCDAGGLFDEDLMCWTIPADGAGLYVTLNNEGASKPGYRVMDANGGEAQGGNLGEITTIQLSPGESFYLENAWFGGGKHNKVLVTGVAPVE